MKTKSISFFALFILFFAACHKEKTPQLNQFGATYSFFVAGHTYGSPNYIQLGLHSPFVNQIPFLNDYPNLTTGIFTGDIVARNQQPFWDASISDINKLQMPIHIAAGNHDRGAIFDSLFQSYYSFMQMNDLFIILSPTDWNIEGAQKDFLKTTIQNHPSATNIFIFVHELLWWNPTNKFSNIKINYAPNYPGSNNYWNEIHPFLDSLAQPITLFAGDLGAHNQADSYMYHQESDNITFVASGMGSLAEDNIIIVDVDSIGGVKFHLCHINTNAPYMTVNLNLYQLP